MNSKWVIVLLTSLSVMSSFGIAIGSLYLALQATKNIIDSFTLSLFENKISMSNSNYISISQNLSQQFQTIPTIMNLVINFYSKILEGEIRKNLNYRPALIHTEEMYSRLGNQEVLALFDKSEVLTSNWYDKNETMIENLTLLKQSLIRSASYLDPIFHTYFLQSLKNEYQKMNISHMQVGYSLDGMMYSISRNTTFKFLEKDALNQDCKFNFDSRSRFWYKSAKDTDSLIINNPNLMNNSDGIPQTSLLFCKRLLIYNDLSKKKELYSVFCMGFKQESFFKSTLENYQNENKIYYLLDPASQIIIFDQSQQLSSSQLLTFATVELTDLVNESERQKFIEKLNNSIELWKKKQTLIDSSMMNSFWMDMQKDQESFYYYRNGTKCLAIISPIYLFDKSLVSDKFMIYLVLIQVNILENSELFNVQFHLEEQFQEYFEILSYILIVPGICSILLGIYYSIRFSKQLEKPIEQLKNMINEISLENLSTISFEIDDEIDDVFYSKETKELFQALQSLFTMIKLTNESFFNSNATRTLLQLYQQLKFFQNFDNTRAIGICHNNIGVLLLSMKDYIHALQHFQESIIYAKYQISEYLENKAYQQDLQQKFSSQINENNQSPSIRGKRLTKIFGYKEDQMNFVNIKQKSNSKSRRTWLELVDKKGYFLQNENTISLLHDSEIGKDKQKGEEQDQNVDKELKSLFEVLVERKINFVLGLIQLQERKQNFRQDMDQSIFWEESKILLEELFQMLDLIDDPSYKGLKLFLLSFLPICLIYLNQPEKAHETISHCIELLDNLPNQINKQIILKLPLLQSYDMIPQKIENDQDHSFTSQNPLETRYNNLDQITKTQRGYLTGRNLLTVPQNDTQQQLFLNQGGSKLDLRSERQSQIFLNFDQMNMNESSLRKKVNQKSLIPRLSIFQINQPIMKTLREKVEQKRSKQQKQIKMDIFDKAQLHCLIQMSLAEVLISQGDILSSVQTITLLLEETSQFLCSIPYQIAYFLNQSFTLLGQSKQESEQLQTLLNKFNPNISFNIFLILCPLSNSKSISVSLHILSALISEILYHQYDLLGILVAQQKKASSYNDIFQSTKKCEKKDYKNLFNKLLQLYQEFSLIQYMSISQIRSIWYIRDTIVEDIHSILKDIPVFDLLRMNSSFSMKTRCNEINDDELNFSQSIHSLNSKEHTPIEHETVTQNFLQPFSINNLNQQPSNSETTLEQLSFQINLTQQQSLSHLQLQSQISSLSIPSSHQKNFEKHFSKDHYQSSIIKRRRNKKLLESQQKKSESNMNHHNNTLSTNLQNNGSNSQNANQTQSTPIPPENITSFDIQKFKEMKSFTPSFSFGEQNDLKANSIIQQCSELDQISKFHEKQNFKQSKPNFQQNGKLIEPIFPSLQTISFNPEFAEIKLFTNESNHKNKIDDAIVNELSSLPHLVNQYHSMKEKKNSYQIQAMSSTSMNKEEYELIQQFQPENHEGDLEINSISLFQENTKSEFFPHQTTIQTIKIEVKEDFSDDWEKEIKNYIFHQCIFRALSQIFQVNSPLSFQNIRFKQKNNQHTGRPSPNLFDFEYSSSPTHHLPNTQIKLIIYTTDEIFIKGDLHLKSLCKLISICHVQILILASSKNESCKIFNKKEILCFQGKEVMRIFYSSRKLSNYINSLRDKFSAHYYPSYVQNF